MSERPDTRTDDQTASHSRAPQRVTFEREQPPRQDLHRGRRVISRETVELPMPGWLRRELGE